MTQTNDGTSNHSITVRPHILDLDEEGAAQGEIVEREAAGNVSVEKEYGEAKERGLVTRGVA